MNNAGDRSRWRTPTIIFAVLFLSGIVFFFTSQNKQNEDYFRDTKTERTPVCVGLLCNDDSDCGTKCNCEIPARQTIGKCVEKSPVLKNSEANELP